MNRLRLGLGLLAAAGLLAALIAQVDARAVADELRRVHLPLLAAALALKVAVIYFKAQRWALAIQAALGGRTLRGVFAASVLGYAANVLLPARLGDAARAAMLSKKNELPLGFSFSTCGACYLLDLMLLGVCLLLVSFGALGGVMSERWTLLLLLGGLLLTALVFMRFAGLARWTGRTISRPFAGWLPESFRLRVQRQAQSIGEGLEGLRRARFLGPLVLQTLVIWAVELAAMRLALWAFALPASWMTAAALTVALNLSFAMPITPGNLGTHQWVSVVVLGLYGVAKAPALAFSLGLQGAVHVTVLSLAAMVALREGTFGWQTTRAAT